MNIETVLTATLQAWRQSRFVWGEADCLISVADYVAALGCPDPGAAWRGTVRTEVEAMAVLKAEGGGFAILNRVLPDAGLKRVQLPRRGDVICARIGSGEIGGLCLGDFCAFRTERGVARLPTHRLEILGAWRP